jgi:signal transduction histidine kinase
MTKHHELNILLVDDDEDDFIVTADLLEDAQINKFNLDWVDNYQDALELISKNQHDVYLFDYRLGEYNGIDLLKESIELGCEKPIIMLTGLGDHTVDETSMKEGAADYLVKGQIDTALLERTIIHAIERKELQAQQVQLLKEVQSANQDLKEFAYIVSHDLKAPLRGINSLANWLLQDYEDCLDEDGKEMLKLMQHRVSRMTDLINGILEYSRVGRINEENVEINLQELVEELINDVVPLERIKVIIKQPLPVIFAEKTRIKQLFQNLISNAVKYMNKHQGKIEIDCCDRQNFWEFSISDNGCGIPSQHFETIFQIFQTLKPMEKSDSTGIGLSVVKKIVELYGGQIWVTSELDQGSTFYFTLPKQAKS